MSASVARDAALTSRSTSTVASELTETDLLLRLSDVSVNLRGLRQDEVTATTELRKSRARVVHFEAPLRADSIALVLDDAVAGGQRAFVSANERAARDTDTLPPLLERLSKAIAELESQADDLRSQLSPTTAHALDTLFRRKILPLVSTLDRGVCGVCHLRLPTALASSTALAHGVHRCPHCKRLLVPPRLDAPVNAPLVNSPDRGS